MATLIQMPKLGLTMTEGTITDWVAEAGQKVATGDVVMLIETDKVEAEVEAVADGVVHQTAAVGETLEPGAGVGWLLADGEAPPDGGAAPTQEAATDDTATPAETPTNGASAPEPAVADRAPGERIKASPNAKRLAAEMAVDLALVVGTGPEGRITSEDVEAAVPPGRGMGGRVLASPNARRIAGLRGIDVAQVTGTGPGGRVTSEDVESVVEAPPLPQPAAGGSPDSQVSLVGSDRFVPFAAAKAAEHLGIDIDAVTGTGPGQRVSRRDVYDHARRVGSSRPPAAAAAADSALSPGDRIPVAGMRKVISQRMHSSLQEMAQLTLAMDVDMDKAVQLREQLKEIGADELGAVPGYTDMVIAAVARALVSHPIANSRFDGDDIVVCEQVNVGMAVAVPDGLVVPVIEQTDQLGLADLAVETSRLAAAARDKKLSLAEMEGGTFSVTTLGMYGVDMFTPIINSPEAGILGVGRIRDDVDWVDDRPVKAKRMTISLTWDHRLLDGAPAAEFASTVKGLLEQPLRLLG